VVDVEDGGGAARGVEARRGHDLAATADPAPSTAPLDLAATADVDRTRASSRDFTPAPAEFAVGAVVGRYVVLERLGAGAMGVVYAAFDPELDRKVALKRVRAGADGGALGHEARTRLVREAQALARLSHPGVVAVHDVGLHGDDVWIAMELVEGRTLRAWLAERPRDWREVYTAMTAVGRGLAAAHAAGLVHRDVKPDNVMISADGRVRLMDFGLARRDAADDEPAAPVPTGERPALSAQVTTAGSLVGTPAYMAPELLAGASAGVAADLFAFCVSFWEGLHGARPFVGDTLAELRARVAAGRLAAPRRRGVPRWLRDVLARGLAPEPARRWPDMAALLAALERGQARARRRRWLLAGAVGLALVGGLLGAREAAARAEVRACEAAGAEVHADWSDAVRADLGRAFVATGKPHAATVFARTAPWLDRWAAAWQAARTAACLRRVEDVWDDELRARADECLDEERALFASLLRELAAVNPVSLNRATTAAARLAPVDRCLDPARLRERPAADPAARHALLGRLAHAAALQATGDLKAGLAGAQAVVADARAAGWSALVASGEVLVAEIEAGLGRYAEAEQTLLRALEAARRADAPRAALAALLQLVVVVGERQSRFAEGRVWAHAARLGVAALAGDERPAEATLDHHLGQLLTAQGAVQEAVPALERALARRTELYGGDHPLVAATLDDLAAASSAAGDLDGARRRGEQALAIHTRAYGGDHPAVAASLSNLGAIYVRAGRYDDALRAHRRALAIRERVLDADHPELAESLNRLGAVYTELRRRDEALRAYERAEAILARSGQTDAPMQAKLHYNIALILGVQGKRAEAAARHEQAAALFTEALGERSVKVSYPLGALALLRARDGRLDEAAELGARALAIRERALGPDDPDVAQLLAELSRIELQRGHPEVAIRHAERSVAIYEARLGAGHVRLAEPLTGLAEALLAARRPDAALAPLARALAITEPRPEFRVVTVFQRFLLAQALWDGGGDRTRARALARQAAADPESRRDPAFAARLAAWLAAHR
jgi:tetratricopeptide (TPR) repeat protein